MAKPKQIAEWMLNELEKTGVLDHEVAVGGIIKLFGSEFIKPSIYGAPAIDKRVLRAFQRLTKDTVVWVKLGPLEKFWRKRRPDDPPGRRQYDY